MADFLQTKRDEISARMRELEPLVEEYHQLTAAAAALAGVSPRTRDATASKRSGGAGKTAAKTSPRASTGRRRGRPPGGGTRARQTIELVKAKPGLTIAELANEMGIKQNYLYRVLPGLAKDKKVVKRGKGWHPRED
jgi:ribosome-binding protein aMBF1 (putative translation factor)